MDTIGKATQEPSAFTNYECHSYWGLNPGVSSGVPWMAGDRLVCSVLSTEQHRAAWKMAVAARSLEQLPCHHCSLMQKGLLPTHTDGWILLVTTGMVARGTHSTQHRAQASPDAA